MLHQCIFVRLYLKDSIYYVPGTRTSNCAYCEIGDFQELDVGLANGIRAMNITHTGELGYVLYVPNEVCKSLCGMP